MHNSLVVTIFFIKASVDRILKQFPALKEYFRLANYDEPSKTLEQIHNTMENYFTFMSYTLGLLTNLNTFFQCEGPLLYMLKPEIEKLLKIVVMNFMGIEYIKTLDTFMIVSPKNIQYNIPLTDIFIGVKATTSITNLKSNISVDSNEVIKFYQEFYIEVVVDIKKIFVFDDPIFKCITATDPALIKQFNVKLLNHVIEQFPVLDTLISSPQELDMENGMEKMSTHGY